MQMCTVNLQDGSQIREVSHQIEHGTGAQPICAPKRQVRHRPNVILKLRRYRSFDGPMTTVVHARRYLVRYQATVLLEELDHKYAHIVQGAHYRCTVSFRFPL